MVAFQFRRRVPTKFERRPRGFPLLRESGGPFNLAVEVAAGGEAIHIFGSLLSGTFVEELRCHFAGDDRTTNTATLVGVQAGFVCTPDVEAGDFFTEVERRLIGAGSTNGPTPVATIGTSNAGSEVVFRVDRRVPRSSQFLAVLVRASNNDVRGVLTIS